MASTSASESSLTDRTNQLLQQYSSHGFKVEELKRAVPLRPSSNAMHQSQHTENFTRYTSMTDITGHSDSGLIMDPDDRERAAEDLKSFKDYVSTLKFAYLENQQKLEFVSHIIQEQGLQLVSIEQTNELEQARLQTKAELKERKVAAAELEAAIRQEAERLEKRYEKTAADSQEAARLLRDCETMELELAMLKNKRTATQRITVEEAQGLLEEQDLKLASFGPEIKAAERKIKETRSRIKGHSTAVDKLRMVNNELKKEQDNRGATGQRDERAEEGCRWFTNSMKLYASLIGIRRAYIAPGKELEMRLEYDSGQADSTRTLSITMGPNGQMVDASLVESSESITDIVKAHLANQDIPSMIQEVRARICR